LRQDETSFSEVNTMPEAVKRNRLMPWGIGLVIILLAVGYAGWAIFSNGCDVPVATVGLVLVVMPAVYLVLMSMTLTSQE